VVRVSRFLLPVLLGGILLAAGCVRIEGPYRCEGPDDCPDGQCVQGVCITEDPAVVEAIPPDIGAVVVPATGGGCVPLAYEIGHPFWRPTDITFFYRLPDETDWRRATPAPAGAISPDDGGPDPKGVQRLPTRPSLRGHTFLWASDVDLPGYEGPVEIAFEAVSGGAVSRPDETWEIALGNRQAYRPPVLWRSDPFHRLFPLRLGPERLAIGGLFEDGSFAIRRPGAPTVEPILEGEAWMAVAAADVTGDGHDEVVLVSPDDLTLHYVRRQGADTYAVETRMPPMFLEGEPIAAAVAAGDVLGEGARLSMAVLEEAAGGAYLTVFSGDAIAGPEVQGRVFVGDPTVNAVHLADLHGGGRLDIIVFGQESVEVFEARRGAEEVEMASTELRIPGLAVVHQFAAGTGGWFGIVEAGDGPPRLHLVRLMPGRETLSVHNPTAVPRLGRITPPMPTPDGGVSLYLLEDEAPHSVVRVTRRGGQTVVETVLETTGDIVRDLLRLDLDRSGRPGLLFARETTTGSELAFASDATPPICVPGLAAPGVILLESAPTTLAVLHLDDDGRPDLVVGFEEATEATSFSHLNAFSGTGSLADWRGPSSPGPASFVAEGSVRGDLTGDGLDDLIVWNASDGVGLLSAQGLGGDHEAPCSPFGVCWMGFFAQDVRAIDANADGRTDLLAIDGTETGIRWLAYDPAEGGRLTDHGLLAQPDGAAAAVVAFDAFHVEDESGPRLGLVVLRGGAAPTVELWIARAARSMDLERLEDWGVALQPVAVAAAAQGDTIWFNVSSGDDAALVTSYRITWDAYGIEGGDSALMSESPTRRMAFGDVTGDGHPEDVRLIDHAAGGHILVRDPDATGPESERRIFLGGALHGLELADVTGDGRQEILVLRGPSDNAPEVPYSVVILSGDRRHPDGVGGTSSVEITGPAEVARIVDFGDAGQAVVRAHAYQGEGLAWSTAVAMTWESEGRGVFQTTGTYREIDGRVVDLVSADLDGDGRPDLAVLTDEPAAVHVFFQDAGRVVGYQGQTSLAGAGRPRSIVAGQTARWGPALAVVSSDDGAPTLRLLAGRERSDWTPALPEEIVVPADLDGIAIAELLTPGRADLVIRGEAGISLLAADDETPPFALREGVILEGSRSAMAVRDVDGDGWPDVVATGPADWAVAYRSPTASPTSSLTAAFGGSSGLSHGRRGPGTDVVVADLSGDGREEMAVLHAASGLVTIRWRSEAFPQSFDRVTLHAVEPGASGLQAIDVDRDGRFDLAVLYPSERRIRILWGR
jgi:hypothetical protein